jgi:hypothetical protein
MSDQQDDEKKEEVTVPAKEPTPTPPQQSSKSSSDEEITPERYKGLQKVVAKRDAELLDQKAKLDKLAEDLEELRSQTSSSEAAKTKLAKDLADAQASLSTAQAEQGRATKRLAQQTIVLKQFPELAPLAEFIPAAESDEDFVKNANALKASLEAYVSQGVKTKLSGAVPPLTQKSNEMVPDGEEDRLWNEINRTAGMPGLEKEYREANDKLQALLSAKQS